MISETAEVTDIANMVAVAVLFHILILHLPARELINFIEGFQDRTRILPATTQVIYLTGARPLVDLLNGPSHIITVYVVADLFALISEDTIGLPQELYFDQIG